MWLRAIEAVRAVSANYSVRVCAWPATTQPCQMHPHPPVESEPAPVRVHTLSGQGGAHRLHCLTQQLCLRAGGQAASRHSDWHPAAPLLARRGVAGAGSRTGAAPERRQGSASLQRPPGRALSSSGPAEVGVQLESCCLLDARAPAGVLSHAGASCRLRWRAWWLRGRFSRACASARASSVPPSRRDSSSPRYLC